MEEKYNVYTYNEVQHEMWRLMIVLLLLFGTVITCVYINNRIESPFILRFNKDFIFDNYQYSYYNSTDNQTTVIDINSQSFGVNFSITNIDLAFSNDDFTYTMNEFVDSYVYNNGSNDQLNALITSGDYMIRTVSITDKTTMDDLIDVTHQFKMRSGYRLMFIRFSLNIMHDLTCNIEHYRFFLPDELVISSTDGYMIEFNSIEQTNNYIYPFGIELNIYKSDAMFLSAYDVSFR